MRWAALGLLAVPLTGPAPIGPPGPPGVGPRVALADPRSAFDEWSLPVPSSTVGRAELRAPHHDYPASDLMVPAGTPVLAVHAGTVRAHRGPRCGQGITLIAARRRFTYCHLAVVAPPAHSVDAGDVLGLSGDTGNAAGVPHLHFHVRDGTGAYLCPQPLLAAWFDGRRPPVAAWSLRTGCFFAR